MRAVKLFAERIDVGLLLLDGYNLRGTAQRRKEGDEGCRDNQ